MTTEIKTNSSCIIISGLFRYQKKAIDRDKLSRTFTDWSSRINQGDFQPTLDYINSAYYDNYLNNMFPGVQGNTTSINLSSSNILVHLTLRQPIEKPDAYQGFTLLLNENEQINFNIEYADLYLFPDEIGIFSIKTVVNHDANEDLNVISTFLSQIRHLHSSVLTAGADEPDSVKNLIENIVLSPLNLKSDWDIYNPQLKTYTLIDLKNPISANELDGLLFDFGNVSKPGTANSEALFAPSYRFFNEQIKSNTISVFKNWGAMALFDTFTRISMNFPDKFKSWEYDYFQIYIHCLYVKFYMYLTNSELSDVTVVTKRTQHLRDKFIEFINDYDLSHISYKFLPNLIHDKLIVALDIHSEIDKMETKIQRLNDHFQERGQRNLNLVLIIITVLSVFSLISELSEWFINLGVSREAMYPFSSIGIGVIILLLLALIFRIKRRL